MQQLINDKELCLFIYSRNQRFHASCCTLLLNVKIASDHLHSVLTGKVNEFISPFVPRFPCQWLSLPRKLFAYPALVNGEIHLMHRPLKLQHLGACLTSLHETDGVKSISLKTDFNSANPKGIVMKQQLGIPMRSFKVVDIYHQLVVQVTTSGSFYHF